MTDLASELRDIERKLFEIPDEKVAQLTMLIERSRAVVMSAAMANAALGTLRPRLAKTRPPRYLSLQRVFCHPFEDLLVLAEGDKQFARVARRSLAPVWDFLTARLDAAAVKELEAALRAAPSPDMGLHADPRIPRLGPKLWDVSAKLLRAELSKAAADAAHKDAMAHELGGEAVLADLADIAAVLELAQPLEALREELSPKPVGRLLEPQVEAIKQAYADLLASNAAYPGYLIAVVIARLSDGFQVLPICDGMGEALTGVEGMKPGQFARAMLSGDCKRFLGNVSKTDPETVSDANVADMVGDFASLLSRLKQDGMAEGAEREIQAATQQLKHMVKSNLLGGIDGKVMGGVSAVLNAPAAVAGGEAAADPEAAKQAVFDAKLEAENRVFALQRVAKVAGEIGAEKDVAGALKDLTGQIETTGSALIADIKAGKLNAEGKEAAKLKLFAALRMLELVAGSNAASRLMKDGLAAIARMPG